MATAHSTLARTLRTTEYFTLAFGTMVGVGWLIVIDDWLIRGGPGGAMLGFLIGGLALVPVAYVYGKFVREIQDAGTELAYANKVFPPSVGFLAGWLMTLAYLIVCPWEAVAIGRLVAYIFPAIQTHQIYSIAGNAVYLPALILGLITTALIIFLNYRGIRISSRFLNYTTFGLLLSFAIFSAMGATHVEPKNYQPLFSHSIPVSIILVLQIVPYFLTGFESVAKCSEESDTQFQTKDFSKAIFLALGVGVAFYVIIIGVVGGLVPWQSLTSERFATAVAFERALGSPIIAKFILIAALLSLLKVFNANFIAASRLIFALGRGGMIPQKLGQINDEHQTPAPAVMFCGLITVGGALLGTSILIPITEVGSMCSLVGWALTCIAYAKWKRNYSGVAIVGAAIPILLLLLKLIPSVPGSFGRWEYVALAVWVGLGVVMRIQGGRGMPRPYKN